MNQSVMNRDQTQRQKTVQSKKVMQTHKHTVIRKNIEKTRAALHAHSTLWECAEWRYVQMQTDRNEKKNTNRNKKANETK